MAVFVTANYINIDSKAGAMVKLKVQGRLISLASSDLFFIFVVFIPK